MSAGPADDRVRAQGRGLLDAEMLWRPLAAVAAFGRRRWDALAAGMFLLMIAATAVSAVAVGFLDWDILPYTAIVYEEDGDVPAVLHQRAYDAVRGHADAMEWHWLTRGYQYFEDMYASADDFVTQLGMFRVKVGYVALLDLMSRTADTVTAAKWINAFAAVLSGAAVFLYMRRSGAIGALPFAAAAMVVNGYYAMHLATQPDALAAAIGVTGLLLAARARFWLAGGFIVLAALVRTDNVVLLLALLLAALAYGEARLAALATFAAGLALVLWATASAGHPGWWPHFYFSVIAQQADMANFHPKFDALLYLKTLVEQTGASFRSSTWLAFTFLLLLGWGLAAARGVAMSRPERLVLLASFLALLGKFVLFPLPLDRVYFPQTCAAAVVLLAAWKPTLARAERA